MRVEYSVRKHGLGQDGGPSLVMDGNAVRVSYTKPASGMAQDAAPRRYARDDYIPKPSGTGVRGRQPVVDQPSVNADPASAPSRNPIAELLDLINSRLDDEDAQRCRDLLAEVFDLEPEVQNGERVQAQDSASAISASRNVAARFAGFNRLKSGW